LSDSSFGGFFFFGGGAGVGISGYVSQGGSVEISYGPP